MLAAWRNGTPCSAVMIRAWSELKQDKLPGRRFLGASAIQSNVATAGKARAARAHCTAEQNVEPELSLTCDLLCFKLKAVATVWMRIQEHIEWLNVNIQK
ncbi:hypothetical protein AC579_1818 [Pseudocercospora musae]|uniref:Uncharacterized protein n=1 Tax=Pseudocercospora musae TaxID=113226 RepID=A0A139IDP1_9PEZI|nr:hypothetical protein AC579_1818 [Pseudocercospora musae]